MKDQFFYDDKEFEIEIFALSFFSVTYPLEATLNTMLKEFYYYCKCDDLDKGQIFVGDYYKD